MTIAGKDCDLLECGVLDCVWVCEYSIVCSVWVCECLTVCGCVMCECSTVEVRYRISIEL